MMIDQNRKATLSTYAGASAVVILTAIGLAIANAPARTVDSLTNGLAKTVESNPGNYSETLLWDANKALVISEDSAAYSVSSDATLESARLASRQNSKGISTDHDLSDDKLARAVKPVFSSYPIANVAVEKSFIELVTASEGEESQGELVQTLRAYGQMSQFSTWRSSLSSGMNDYRLLSPSLASAASSNRGNLAMIASIGSLVTTSSSPGVESKSPVASSVLTADAHTPGVLQSAASVDTNTVVVTQSAAEAVPEPGSMALLLVGLLLVGIRGQALRSR